MAITICFANYKGGVAKTTTCYATAISLHNRGYKVLMVDADPQANLCEYVGIDTEEREITLYSVLKNNVPVTGAIESLEEGLDILTNDMLLAAADSEFTRTGREYLLRDIIQPIAYKYDFIVMDTGPNLGVMTTNALTASDYVVIPLTADRFPMKGNKVLHDFIMNIKAYCNPNLSVTGILVTKFDTRKTINNILSEEIEEVAANLGTIVFKSRIREAVEVRNSQLLQKPLSKKSPVSQDYEFFVNELLTRI